MITNKIKIGDKYYQPIAIKVEYKQDFPLGISGRTRALAIQLEEEEMIKELNKAINEHVIKSGVIKEGHLHTSTIELMILKPIQNGE